MSIIVTLEGLNSIRIMNNKTPLKSWKESKAKLAEAYAKEEHAAAVAEVLAAQIEENKAANEKITRDKAAVAKMYAPKKTTAEKLAAAHAASNKLIAKALASDPELKAKVTAKPKMLKRTQTAIDKATKLLDRAQGNIVNVATIAKELGVNAKVARATIRRKNVDRTDAAAIRAALTK